MVCPRKNTVVVSSGLEYGSKRDGTNRWTPTPPRVSSISYLTQEVRNLAVKNYHLWRRNPSQHYRVPRAGDGREDNLGLDRHALGLRPAGRLLTGESNLALVGWGLTCQHKEELAAAMTIEIHGSELETLIMERVKMGGFQNVEDALMQALQT